MPFWWVCISIATQHVLTQNFKTLCRLWSVAVFLIPGSTDPWVFACCTGCDGWGSAVPVVTPYSLVDFTNISV